MSVKNYGILKARPLARLLATSSDNHYRIHVIANHIDFEVAVDVYSELVDPKNPSFSQVMALVDENFSHAFLKELKKLNPGFQLQLHSEGHKIIDYVRGNLFNHDEMKPLPYQSSGSENSLDNLLDKYVNRAIQDERAMIYAFGSRWGPEDRKDQYFGFIPGNGIHDIHMNQGNPKRNDNNDHSKDNGVWQDGALLINFPAEQKWIAIFLKFQSQSWKTDAHTGNPI